jgi:hypothetical protein
LTETATCGRLPWVRIAAMVTWRCTAAAIAALCGAGLACSPGAEPKATIASVSPPSAYNDVGLSLDIKGGDFRPAYEFDTMAGAASVQQAFTGVLSPAASAGGLASVVIDPVLWNGPRALRATVPAGVAAGVYDVTITDPRGEVITLPASFTSLGQDLHPPVIVVEHPRADTIIGAGAEVTVMLSADDGRGSLTTLDWVVIWSGERWRAGTCAIGAGASSMPCSFRFMAPPLAAGLEPMAIQLTAVDSMANVDPVTIPLLLAPRPTLITLSAYNGAAGGKQPLVVTGTGFVPSNSASSGSVVVIDGQELKTDFKSQTELEATTVAHDPGIALVSVRTGGADSRAIMFQFYPAPIVKAIAPQSGPEAGGNPIVIVGRHFRLETQIVFNDGSGKTAELERPRYVSATRIEGFVPANPTGSAVVNVAAFDQLGGFGQLLGAYVYENSP